VIAFCRTSPDRSNAVLAIVTLDYARPQRAWVRVPVDDLGLSATAPYPVTDLLDGSRATWQGAWQAVQLDPLTTVARVLSMPIAAAPARAGIAPPEAEFDFAS
jgi:hypothetical protein